MMRGETLRIRQPVELPRWNVQSFIHIIRSVTVVIIMIPKQDGTISKADTITRSGGGFSMRMIFRILDWETNLTAIISLPIVETIP